MFYAVRIFVIIATILFGVSSQADEPAISDVVLEDFPEIAAREQKRAEPRKRKYRTPFIVPISPPHFGDTKGPESLSREPTMIAERPTSYVASIRFHASDRLPSASLPQRRRFEPFRFASQHTLATSFQIVAMVETQSKTVSVVRPNLTALADRIALHNLGVKASYDQLRQRDTWTLSDLESVVEQLESLQSSRQLLALYWNLLEPKAQWRVGSLVNPDDCIELVQQRLFETRVALDIQPRLVTSLPEDQAVTALTQLESRVNRLGKRSPELQ